MNPVLAALAVLLSLTVLLAGATWAGTRRIEKRHPPGRTGITDRGSPAEGVLAQ